MNRQYYIITGSQKFFDDTITQILNRKETLSDPDDFLELIKQSELCRTSGIVNKYESAYIVVRNNHYHGVTNEAHYRIGVIIEELTMSNAVIFIHNPPINLVEHVKMKAESKEATLEFRTEQYSMEKDATLFSEKMKGISRSILGQNIAIEETT